MLFTPDKTINRILWVSYTCYLLLLAAITLNTWQSPLHFWSAWLLQVLPLLLLLPGMIMKYYRSYSWLCFLMLAYFTNFVVQAYAPNRDYYDWLGLGLTIVLFISAMFASRWLQRLTKQ
jgi:uncharacterized membrane protein